MLKIAVLVSSFPSISEKFIVTQVIELLKIGHDVRIFAFQKGEVNILHNSIREYNLIERTFFFEDYYFSGIKRYGPFLKFIRKENANLGFLNLIKNFNFLKYGRNSYNLRFFYKVFWILKEGPFDVFHGHFGPNGEYFAQIKKKGLAKNTRLICSFHGYDLHPKEVNQYTSAYRALIRQSTILTVNSPYSYDLLKTIAPGEKIKLLPVGLDINFFSKTQEREEHDIKNLLFVGRLVKLKGPDLAIEILNYLIKNIRANVNLKIIGAGGMMEECLELVEKFGLENHVEFLGALGEEDIKEEMGKADVFLLPGILDDSGRAETQGLVIQEAQSMELPVVISDVGGMKYGIINEETGYVVQERDIQGFSTKINFLLENDDIRLLMGRKGRKNVSEKYEAGALGKRLEEIYYSSIKN